MGSIFIQFPKGKKKALTLSYDDGVEQDIRLIEIMKQHGLKGTFNLNSGLYAEEGTVYPPGTVHRRMTEKAVTEVYGGSGMEVAVHGLTHPFLEQLPVNLCTAEVMKDRENLERQFHTIVRGMLIPSVLPVTGWSIRLCRRESPMREQRFRHGISGFRPTGSV